VAKADILEMLARTDAGIHAPSDLKGKKIGIIFGTNTEFFLRDMLLFNNMSVQDVTTVNLSPAAMEEALTEGVVDAVVIGDIIAQQIKNSFGKRVAVWSAPVDQKLHWLLVTDQRSIERHERALERLIASLVQATAYIETYPDQSKVIIAKRANIKKELLDELFPRYDFAVSLDHTLLLAMENDARWTMGQHLPAYETVPNFLDFIHFHTLETARPEAVTIIH